MTAQEHAERIALSLEAGPEAGEWITVECGEFASKLVVANDAAVSLLTVVDEEGVKFGAVYDDATADFIAAANPAALTDLLSERTALLAMVGELEGALSTIAKRMDSRWPDDCIANVEIARAALKGQP